MGLAIAFFRGLNPCSNGRWSLSTIWELGELINVVLILVLMADGL